MQKADLCRSHIIPEFLYSTLYDDKHHFIALEDVESGEIRKGQKGHRERLLCSGCESLINKFEKHSRRLFVDPLPAFVMGSVRIREHPRLDYNLLKLFFLSILWRASVSSLPLFEHVYLGPHEELIRKMLVSGQSGASTHYPIAIFALNYDGDHFRDLLVQPTYARVEGRRCYRFVMMGFVVFIFVASMPAPSPFPLIALNPEKPVRSFSAEFNEFGFLKEVWRRAGESTKDHGD
ncbi:MAG TPA: hypothetical protein VGH19_05080 [Verrucomicrobiae bacterium]